MTRSAIFALLLDRGSYRHHGAHAPCRNAMRASVRELGVIRWPSDCYPRSWHRCNVSLNFPVSFDFVGGFAETVGIRPCLSTQYVYIILLSDQKTRLSRDPQANLAMIWVIFWLAIVKRSSRSTPLSCSITVCFRSLPPGPAYALLLLSVNSKRQIVPTNSIYRSLAIRLLFMLIQVKQDNI